MTEHEEFVGILKTVTNLLTWTFGLLSEHLKRVSYGLNMSHYTRLPFNHSNCKVYIIMLLGGLQLTVEIEIVAPTLTAIR